MERTFEFMGILGILLTLMMSTLPADSPEGSPQYVFLSAFELALESGLEDYTEGMEEQLNALFEAHGINLDEMEDDIAQMFGLDFASLESTAALDADVILGDVLGAFGLVDFEVVDVPAQLILDAVMAIDELSPLVDLLSEELVLSFLETTYAQWIYSAIVYELIADGGEADDIEVLLELVLLIGSDALGFLDLDLEINIPEVIDYGFGAGSFDALVALPVTERFELLGTHTGDYFVRFMVDEFDFILESLDILLLLDAGLLDELIDELLDELLDESITDTEYFDIPPVDVNGVDVNEVEDFDFDDFVLPMPIVSVFALDAYELEERVADVLTGSANASLVFSGDISGYFFNFFVQNNGSEAASLNSELFEIELAPGARFTIQLTAEQAYEFIAGLSSDAELDVYFAFRVTAVPLQ